MVLLSRIPATTTGCRSMTKYLVAPDRASRDDGQGLATADSIVDAALSS
jgi:hypothetical protein